MFKLAMLVVGLRCFENQRRSRKREIKAGAGRKARSVDMHSRKLRP